MTRIERVREAIEHDKRDGVTWASYLVADMEALLEAADAVIGFCDLEPGYKGGALTEAAKKLLEQVE